MEPLKGTFRAVGLNILNFLRDLGGSSLMLLSVTLRLKELPRTHRQTLLQMQAIGLGSIPLVIVTALFVGAVAAVQAAYQFQDYVPMVFLGTVGHCALAGPDAAAKVGL